MDLPIEMYKKYIERRKADVTQLQEAVSSGSVEVFKRIGHQIRGNASSFGFEDLAQIGTEMEELDSSTIAIDGKDILEKLNIWIAAKEKEFTS